VRHHGLPTLPDGQRAEDFVHLPTLARFLGRDRRTVWRWTRWGMPFVKSGRDYFAHIPSVQTWLRERGERRPKDRVYHPLRGEPLDEERIAGLSALRPTLKL